MSLPRLMVVLDRRACADDGAWLERARGAAELAGDEAIVQLRLKGLEAGHREALLDALGEPSPCHALSGAAEEATRRGFRRVHWPEVEIPERAPPIPAATASVHSLAAARQARSAGASAVVFGPVRAPRSKPGAGRGVEALASFTGACPLPVFAIGGLELADIPVAFAAGAAGVAALTPFAQGSWTSNLRSWLTATKNFYHPPAR